MPNPDWKYGDILRPAVGMGPNFDHGDRILYLAPVDLGEAQHGEWFIAVNLTLPTDNETWMGRIDNWELDTDA